MGPGWRQPRFVSEPEVARLEVKRSENAMPNESPPKDIVVSSPHAHVWLVVLNRPSQLNALSANLMAELGRAMTDAAGEDEVRCVVITGGDEVFAAGADLKEMAARDMIATLTEPTGSHWEPLHRFPKPLIAAVNGYALGGGCELAMHADIIIAGDTARFGQPEVNVGIMPGAGGTQRLVRSVGKSLAMKMILAGEMIDARAALAAGLVAEVVPHETTVARAIALAGTIAEKPPIAVRLAKEAVLRSFDMALDDGLSFERRLFALTIATDDKAEGVAAFLEKRKATFKGR